MSEHIPTVLLVAPNEHLPESIAHHLREIAAQCEIITAADEAQALAELRQRRVALLIVPYRLPKQRSGINAAFLCKVASPGTTVVVVGRGGPDTEQQAREAGVEFLRKPYSYNQLQAIVRAACGRT